MEFPDEIADAQPHRHRSGKVVQGVKLSISVYASIPFLICCVVLFFYEINKAMETRIETELAQRRGAAS